ncbi:hypothetical protein [Taylorella asinigenitalis]|uniref:Uncharacterized protein n=1 Tax=Taylorella asinigenitalis (strain MCE3) TaxID=1008459 RepID=G4QD93_TAYAM|nr:hypothetical protein [Taylorella asinigenitalis]AEP35910.1 hypothetical protein TASI_0119 [Taylorella asinigenitalis MCE3]
MLAKTFKLLLVIFTFIAIYYFVFELNEEELKKFFDYDPKPYNVEFALEVIVKFCLIFIPISSLASSILITSIVNFIKFDAINVLSNIHKIIDQIIIFILLFIALVLTTSTLNLNLGLSILNEEEMEYAFTIFHVMMKFDMQSAEDIWAYEYFHAAFINSLAVIILFVLSKIYDLIYFKYVSPRLRYKF